MKKILMVFVKVPYPLQAHGASIRYLPVIKYLSKRYLIDLIVIGDSDADSEKIDALKAYCRNVSVIPNPEIEEWSLVSRILKKIGLMLPSRPPLSLGHYEYHKIIRKIADVTAGIHYDSLLLIGRAASLDLRFLSAGRSVVDFVDSPSLNAQRQVSGGYKSLLLQKYECWRTKRWEANVIRNSAANIYISPVDAQAIPRKLTPGCKRYVIPNGICTETYTPSVKEAITSPSIGFLGNMGYLPNIEAAHWLYEQVFLPLQAEIPNLTMHIIGRCPVESVLRLSRKKGVHVTGTVDNIWPYVNAVDVFVFPLQRGTGLKNKILEAMYAKRPVVTTRIGNEGIDGVSGRDLIVCHKASEICQVVKRLLSSAEEQKLIGESAHQFVMESFSWGRILNDFESVITGEKVG